MKKSTAVTLVLSGSLLAGCDNSSSSSGPVANGTVLTNNTYSAGYGYWHAPYHGWFPYPYNFYRPGYGYYYGGSWGSAPEAGRITSSAVLPRSSWSSGYSGGSHSSGGGFFSGGSTSRGGFGSSGHASS